LRRGFSLVEVTLAVGVAGFCLLSLFGLLPVGLSSNQTSLEQTMAGNIAGAIVADLRCAQPLVTGTSPHFLIPIPAAGAAGSMHTVYLASNGSATSVDSGPVTSGSSVSRYRATIQFYPPQTVSTQAGPPRTATSVRLLITWPALADSNPDNLPSNYTGSCEVDTTLDRN
jgi:hypothetical protein